MRDAYEKKWVSHPLSLPLSKIFERRHLPPFGNPHFKSKMKGRARCGNPKVLMGLGAIQWPTLLSHERENKDRDRKKIRIVSIVQTNIPKTARKRFRGPNEICPGPNSWLMHEGGRKLFSVPLLITALTQFGSSFRVGEMRHCMNKTGKLIPPAKRSWAAKENNGNGEAFSERSGEKVEWRNGEQSSVREKEVREKKWCVRSTKLPLRAVCIPK